jgi:hypothetical protein
LRFVIFQRFGPNFWWKTEINCCKHSTAVDNA